MVPQGAQAIRPTRHTNIVAIRAPLGSPAPWSLVDALKDFSQRNFPDFFPIRIMHYIEDARRNLHSTRQTGAPASLHDRAEQTPGTRATGEGVVRSVVPRVRTSPEGTRLAIPLVLRSGTCLEQAPSPRRATHNPRLPNQHLLSSETHPHRIIWGHSGAAWCLSAGRSRPGPRHRRAAHRGARPVGPRRPQGRALDTSSSSFWEKNAPSSRFRATR